MRVKRCTIEQIEPGMELAYPIIKESNQLFLVEGTVLTETIINRLKTINVSHVDVVDTTRAGGFTSTSKALNPIYNDTIQVIKSCFSTIRYFKEVPLYQMKELVDTSIDPLVDAIGIIGHLHKIRRQDDYTFSHSLNVAVIAGILGKWNGFAGNDLKDLILAGLLHDIGKIRIPLEILNKPAKLTDQEMEKMKQHTIEGYNILVNSPGVSDDVLYGVMQHHERLDGSGYPHGIRGENIHRFAKIIAIADIYDAMTSDRVYNRKRTPFDVVEVINREMFDKLDPRACVIFLNNVTDYFIGARVKLSDGREAEVVYRGGYYASRPSVCTQDGEFINLEKSKEIAIVELVSN